MNPPPQRFSDAFRTGFRLAAHAPGLVALGLLAATASSLLAFGSALAFGALAARVGLGVLAERGPAALLEPAGAARDFLQGFASERILLPVAGAGLVAFLVSELIRLLWVAAAGRLFAARLAGDSRPLSLERASRALLNAVPAIALLAAASLAALLFASTAIGSAALYYVHAFARERGGAGAAAALALALALGFFLRQAAALLARLTVLRAAAERGTGADAVLRAGRFLGARLPAVVGTALVFAVLQGALGFGRGLAGLLLDAGSAPAAQGIALVLGFMLDLALGVVRAFLSCAELGAFVALGACGEAAAPLTAPPPATAPDAPSEPSLP